MTGPEPTAQEDYKVELEIFEGPLDLLLYLIKREEVDIYDIPIERITTQYMQYMDLMRMLDLDIAGEFIVMAATLMMIKSRMLLPVEQRPEIEEEEGEDPRWDLVRRLVEYKKFKEIANHLHERQACQENVFARTDEDVPEDDDPGVGLRDVSIFDLIGAFNTALQRIKQEDLGQIFADRFTVADKIELILQTLNRQEEMPFSRLFESAATRHEIICTFLALLELIRLRHVNAVQAKQFGEIKIVKCA